MEIPELMRGRCDKCGMESAVEVADIPVNEGSLHREWMGKRLCIVCYLKLSTLRDRVKPA